MSTSGLSFKMKVLGRTLEHLGVQMYKKREAAIAELIANAWDAHAKEVKIKISTESDPKDRVIEIEDNGIGMNPTSIQNSYLVVGRNRRKDLHQGEIVLAGRPVMGRKGIGKLAGFGLASIMEVVTWQSGKKIKFTLDVSRLKIADGTTADISISAEEFAAAAEESQGTHIILKSLKHTTKLDPDKLRESLARRFSSKVRGIMAIKVNEIDIGEPTIHFQKRIPETETIEETVGGFKIKYFYGFSKEVIKNTENRGFTVHVRGKTAQAPPFFFNAESTASGQHATRYLTGVIEADFLDDGTDDDTDVISTDRQEIDWDSTQTTELHAWGEKLTRRALREWVEMRGSKVLNDLMEDEDLKYRIEALDRHSQTQVKKFIKNIGTVDDERSSSRNLADALVMAYEFQNFHGMIAQLEEVGADENNPELLVNLLSHINDWGVLESRAILEIVKGRLKIIEKFHTFIVTGTPETASSKSKDNIHDLIAGYPWIIDPEWQILSEEKTISKQLQEWNNTEDLGEGMDKTRYDFLALTGEQKYIIIEIKRSTHSVDLEELQRLEKYKSKLVKARNPMMMVMICGGNYNLDPDTLKQWQNRTDAKLLTWAEIHERASKHYEHYRAVLEKDTGHGTFKLKEAEVKQTRNVLALGTVHRTKEQRQEGIGPQDADHLPKE